MVKKRTAPRSFPTVTLESLRIVRNLIPRRSHESATLRSYKLAKAVLQKFLGSDWVDRYIDHAQTRFLKYDTSSALATETHRMRVILLAEMLFNLQMVRGFRACLVELYGGQIESTYATLEVGRALTTMATDNGINFRFVARSGIKRRDYDLSITFSDGVRVRAEAKCKLEETANTLNSIKRTLQDAQKQLPPRAPGMIFVKVPRGWLDDERFAEGMQTLAKRFLGGTKRVVSLKYLTAIVVREEFWHGDTVGEIIAYQEHSNANHRFRKLRNRDWNIFPETPLPRPPSGMSYNGMPAHWHRLFLTD